MISFSLRDIFLPYHHYCKTHGQSRLASLAETVGFESSRCVACLHTKAVKKLKKKKCRFYKTHFFFSRRCSNGSLLASYYYYYYYDFGIHLVCVVWCIRLPFFYKPHFACSCQHFDIKRIAVVLFSLLYKCCCMHGFLKWDRGVMLLYNE